MRRGGAEGVRRSGRRRSGDELFGYLFGGFPILLLLIILFAPMLYSFYLSLFETTALKATPEFIGLRGFSELFKDKYTWVVIRNSIIWTGVVAFFQLAIGLFSALLLRDPFPGRWFVRGLVILPWVVPGVVSGMLWRLIYDAQIGLMNYFLISVKLIDTAVDWLGLPKLALYSVIITAIWKGFPFSTLMCLAALQTVPQENYEAASIDGANEWQKFIFITIPGIGPVLRLTMLLISVWTFNYFEIIWVMTRGGPVRSTHIFPTFIYETSFRNFNFGNASRIAVVSFIIVSILTLLYLRQIKKSEQF
jgi:multiple sugar transport system permease protein